MEITPISKKSPSKVFNWDKYLRDMWVSVARAFSGAIITFGSSNAVQGAASNMDVESLTRVGINWKQACIVLLGTIVFDLARYVNLNPLPPEEVTEYEDTQNPNP